MLKKLRTGYLGRRPSSGPRVTGKDQPGLWWLTAAGYPVTSGALGSIALSFEICGITQAALESYTTDGGADILGISDPAWGVVLKAFAIVFSIGAWLTMVYTMVSPRSTPRGFVPATISWFSSAVILLIYIGVMAPRENIGHSNRSIQFTQGFFYTTFAAGICLLIAVFLSVYICTSWKLHLEREDRYSIENPVLMVRVMIFQAHVLAGAAVFSAVEGWTFMNAVYWADYTVLTIGIGNIVPKTHLGRSLLFPYATLGIIFLGLIIGALQSYITSLRTIKLRLKTQKVYLQYIQQHHHSHRNTPQPFFTGSPGTFPLPREEDFKRLHHLQSRYTYRTRWHIFLLSTITLFFLWFLSAAIFRRSEEGAHWTYFEALYFTYTSLTTIGYGDFYPTSNFGTSFFVFWSLLAVPVLTFLISEMGNTLLSALRKYTNRLIYSKRLPFRRFLRRENENHNALDPEKQHQSAHLRDDVHYGEHDSSTLDSHLRYDLTKIRHKPIAYAFLLAQEVHALAETLKRHPKRRYTYKEWTEVFALLNHDAYGKPHGNAPAPQQTNTSSDPLVPNQLRHAHNPVLSGTNETLWILEHFARKLALVLEERFDTEDENSRSSNVE